MTLALIALALAGLLTLVSFVQILYLESLRLRARESEALAFFKESLEEMIGYEDDQGALTFSLLKHTIIVAAGAALPAAGWMATKTWVGFAEGTALAWLMVVACGYLLPHILYRRSSGGWVIPLVPLVRFMALLLRPLTALLEFLNTLHALAEPAGEEEEEGDLNEEIEALISAGEEEGIIEKEDSRLIHSVVAFGDKRVREVMTPRREMIAISRDRTLEDLRTVAKAEQYSRILVYEEAIDRVVGFVHVRDLFELEEAARQAGTIGQLMRPINGVPETKLASDLVKEMQTSGTHIVYVVDEYGNVAGLVTLEDLLEEIVGEIRDEHEPAHDIQRHEDGAVSVSGSFDVDHLRELFDFRPETEFESTTIGGLVTEWLGSVPGAGEFVEREGLRLDVLASDGLRVLKVRISRTATEEEEEPETA